MISLLFFLTEQFPLLAWLKSSVLSQGPSLCATALPTSSYQHLSNSLICGAALPANGDRQLFIDTGLIHLMVVSGSHLIFLEMMFAFLPTRVRLVLLGAYCYFTGFQAPVVRAFLRRAIARPLQSHFGFLTPLQLEAAAAIVALFIYPEWMVSRSFLMSWMCGLALSTPALFRGPWRHFDQALKSYVFLVPFCWASPVSILWNTWLAPLVGFLLFPVCLASMIFPFLVVVSDGVWAAFLFVLRLGPQAPQLPVYISTVALCGVPVTVHLVLLVAEVQWRRAYGFSSLSRFSAPAVGMKSRAS